MGNTRDAVCDVNPQPKVSLPQNTLPSRKGTAREEKDLQRDTLLGMTERCRTVEDGEMDFFTFLDAPDLWPQGLKERFDTHSGAMSSRLGEVEDDLVGSGAHDLLVLPTDLKTAVGGWQEMRVLTTWLLHNQQHALNKAVVAVSSTSTSCRG